VYAYTLCARDPHASTSKSARSAYYTYIRHTCARGHPRTRARTSSGRAVLFARRIRRARSLTRRAYARARVRSRVSGILVRNHFFLNDLMDSFIHIRRLESMESTRERIDSEEISAMRENAAIERHSTEKFYDDILRCVEASNFWQSAYICYRRHRVLLIMKVIFLIFAYCKYCLIYYVKIQQSKFVNSTLFFS